MRKFTDKEVLDRIRGLDTFLAWPNGPMDVWVRSRADTYNAFDDKAFTYECCGPGNSPRFIMARSGTTNAGSYGLKHFDRYGRNGCAVLRSDTIVYESHRYGLHHGKAAYVQVKGFPYYRDSNRNDRAEESGPVFDDVIGANVHRAGQNSTVIDSWSIGCLVTARLERFLAFLTYIRSKGDPPLTVCILKEW